MELKTLKKIIIFWQIVCLIPIWIFDFLPSVDLAQHAVQAEYFKRLLINTTSTECYQINWLSPFILPTIILSFFQLFFNALVSVKIIISLIFLSTTYICLKLAQTKYPTELLFIAIPLYYSFAYYWGFIPFLCAIPIFLSFINLILSEQEQTKSNLLFISLHLVLLIFTHILFFCIAAIILIIFSILKKDLIKNRLIKLIPLFVSLPAYIFVAYELNKNNQLEKFNFLLNPNRIVHALLVILGGPLPEQYAYFLILILLFIIFIYPGIKLGDPLKSVILLFLIGILLLGPKSQGTAYYWFERFGILVFPFLSFLTVKHIQKQFFWMIATIPISIIILIQVIILHQMYNQEIKGFKKILACMEPNKFLLTGISEKQSLITKLPNYDHLTLWYPALKQGTIEPIIFTNFAQMLIRRSDQCKKNSLSVKNLNYQSIKNYYNIPDYILLKIDKIPPDVKDNLDQLNYKKLCFEDNWKLYKK